MSSYSRWQLEPIQEALRHWRVILLAGARQCGKTTLARALAGNDFSYRTLDDDAVLESAIKDPAGFVAHDYERLIINEIQRAPQLLRAIKKVVDIDQRPGRFLITGSTNIASMPGANESLAGRVRKMRLRPLAWGELLSKKPDFIPAAFAQTFSPTGNPLRKQELIDIALRGGFPEAIRGDAVFRRQWHRSYIEMLMDRDLHDLTHIKRQDAMYQLITVMAAWSGNYMDLASIGRTLSINRATLEAYIGALEALFLIECVTPWTKTDYDRVGKQTKIFMSDSGLMSSILGWHADDIQWDWGRCGKLVETWTFNEIAAQLEAQPIGYALYHYRDREKREVDFIIEREDGALLGIEVKAGSTADSDSFKHLRWFKEHIARDRSFVGIVLHSGEHVLPFGPDLWAVPYSALYGELPK